MKKTFRKRMVLRYCFWKRIDRESEKFPGYALWTRGKRREKNRLFWTYKSVYAYVMSG